MNKSFLSRIAPARRRFAALACAALVLLPTLGFASSYTWDADPNTDGVQDGLGIWTNSVTVTNWLADGVAPNVPWVQGSDAVFGGGTTGTAGTINVSAIVVSNMTFNHAFAGNYNISGTTLTFTNGATVTVNTGGDVTFASNLRGFSGFTKSGSGTLTLSPGTANVYTGVVEVANGTLSDSASTGKQAIGPDGLLIDAGATFIYASGKIGAISSNASITNNGGTIMWGSSETNPLVSVVLANSGVISNFTSSDRTMLVNGSYLFQSGTVAYSDNNGTNKGMILAGTAGLTKTTPGTVFLLGTNGTQSKNTYSGITTLSGGILNLGHDTAIGINPAVFTPNQLTLDGGTLQVSFAYSWGTNRGITITTNGGTLDLMPGLTQTIPVPIAGSAGGSLTKTDNGILKFTGTNTYNGNTVINGGTLALSGSGSIASSPVISIAGGATFDVSATTTPLVLDSSQTLRATGTASAGTIATATSHTLTLGPTSGLQFSAFNGAVAPLAIAGTGTLGLSAGNVVTVTVSNGGTPLGANDYKLISIGTSGGVVGTAPSAVTVNGDGIIGGATPSLAITGGELFLHVGSGGPPPTTNHISFTGSTASIAVAGLPNTPYVLQTTTNLPGGWVSIQTNTTDSGGALTFTDGGATNQYQFYRTLH